MKPESKDVAVKQQTSLAETVASAMQDIGVGASDLVIPRLLLMQNTSEAVGDSKAKLGDILNSQTNEVVGGVDAPLGMIPLKLYKTWRVMDISGKQAEYVREEPVTAANEKRDWEGEEELPEKGLTPVRYDFSYNFFVLLTKDIAEDEAFPALLTFRRTSTRAGKALATHLFKRVALQKEPFSKTIKLAVTKQKHETNTYAVFEIQPGENCSAKELEQARKWMPLLSQMRVDEEKDVKDEAAPAAPVVLKDTAPSEGPY